MIMTNKISLFLGAITGVLILALVAGMVSLVTTPRAQAQGAGVTGMRQITVVGNGEITGVPDTATVEIGVETQAPTTSEALAQNNTQVSAVIDRLTQLGIAENDVQTRNFNMYARYDDEGRDVVGYTVSNTVLVTIRDLDQAGSLLDEVVQVGANRIYGITFRVDDPSDLLSQARDQALANAREKAAQMAQVSGAALGEVLVITENIGSPPPMPIHMIRDMAVQESAQAQVPVQAGEQSFSASVQVTFALR